jgi:DNA-binding LacI/PurR family transcriptional regulator
MSRPTISDIAARAGVSKAAVSYALNGRTGVSPATTARVLAIAEELGWTANRAARVLSGARAGVVGLVIARPAQTLGLEPFFMEFISGIELELSRHEVALMLQLVPDHATELQTYRRWQGAGQVDGVLLVDLHEVDDRCGPLQELALPFVVAGDTRDLPGTACVWTDEAAGMTQVVEYLAALGHRRIGRVSGLEAFRHTAERTRAFHSAAGRLALDEVMQQSDYSGEESTRATRRLLAQRHPPTAIVYDSDVMAVAGLSVAAEMGVDVPGQLSVVSWDDSVLCRLTHPAITALAHDSMAYGSHVARTLLQLIDGDEPRAHPEMAHTLVPRGSTSPPRRPLEAPITG